MVLFSEAILQSVEGFWDYTIRIAKTRALISFAVTAKLICAFDLIYAKIRFSHNEAHIKVECKGVYIIRTC